MLLAPEDAAVYTRLHASIGELTPTWSPAIGLLDLRLLLLTRGGPLWRDIGLVLDADLVPVRAHEWGPERMLYATLRLTRRVFPGLATQRFCHR